MSGYDLRGTVLDACQCGVPCPCWLGEPPDEGEHHGFIAYHVTEGEVDGVDVSGATIVDVFAVASPSQAHGRSVVRLIDARATSEQAVVLRAAFSGHLGGPLAETAAPQVVEAMTGVDHDVAFGSGTIAAPPMLEAVIEPVLGAAGAVANLRDATRSPVPGEPAWVCRASRHRVHLPDHGMSWEYWGRSAIQAVWRSSR